MKTFKRNILLSIISIGVILITAAAFLITSAFYQGRRTGEGSVIFDKGIQIEIDNGAVDSLSKDMDLTLQYYPNKDTSQSKLDFSVAPTGKTEYYIANPSIITTETSEPFYLRLKLECEYYVNGSSTPSTFAMSEGDQEVLFNLFFTDAHYSPVLFNDYFAADAKGEYYYYVSGGYGVATKDNLAQVGPNSEISFFKGTIVNGVTPITTVDFKPFGDSVPGNITKISLSLKMQITNSKDAWANDADLPDVELLDKNDITVSNGQITAINTNATTYGLPGYIYDDEGNVVSTITSIASGVNSIDSNAVKVFFPSTLTTVGGYCNTPSLTNVYLGNNVQTIASNAFTNAKLSKHLILPKSLTTIGESAYQNCSTLTGKLTFPYGVNSIGASAFAGCAGFSGELLLPNGVTQINPHTFEGCAGFTGALNLQNVSTIGDNAFASCSGFNGTLNLSTNLTSIGSNAFAGCVNLQGPLTIPSNVSTIGGAAFAGCSNFKTVIIDSTAVAALDSSSSNLLSYADEVYVLGTNTTVGNYITDSFVETVSDKDGYRRFGRGYLITWNGGSTAGTLDASLWNFAGINGYSATNSGDYSKYSAFSGKTATSMVGYGGKNLYSLPIPLIAGHTFDGWYSASTGGVKVANADGTWANNATGFTGSDGSWIKNSATTLYARYTKKVYTISYNYNNGIAGATAPTNYSVGAETIISNPTRTGYTFTGWTITATLSGKTNGSINANTGILEYNSANPSAVFYELTYISSGTTYTSSFACDWNAYTSAGAFSGRKSTTNSYTSAGNYLLSLANPTSNANANVSLTFSANSFTIPASFTGNLQLTANWEANKYTVTLDNQSATNAGTTSVTATYDSAMPAITVPTRTGYTFGGYFSETEGNGTRYYNANGTSARTWDIASDATLYAKWTINTATITIKKDGSNWSSSGMNVALYSGSTLKYAYSSATASGATVTFSAVVNGTYNVYATRATGDSTLVDTGVDITVNSTGSATINYYTLTLSKGTGISSVSGAGVYLSNQTASISATVTSGYTFVNWTVGSGNTPASATATSTTVSMSKATSLTANAADKTAPTVSISRTDYNTFSWTASDGVGVTGYAITNSSAVPSSWTTTGTLTSGSYDISATANTWYVWVKDAAGNTKSASIASYEVTRSQGTGTTLTTKYENSSGTAFTNSPVYVLSGTPIHIAVSANAGYHGATVKVNGSAFTSGNTHTVSAATAIASSATANTYTVVFNANKPTGASSSVSGSTANQGFTYDVAQNLNANGFSLTGWTFQGWNTAANGSGTSYADKASVKNLTATNNGTVNLYAQWKANTYTVVFNANKPTGASSSVSGSTANQGFTYDVAQNLRANGFTLTGWTFQGWNTAANGSGTSYADKASVKNLTVTNNGTVNLYAQWAPNPYTVKFDANGGSGTMADQAFTYDVSQNLTANAFTHIGYHFTGWNTAANGSGTAYADEASVKNLTSTYNGTVTLYAQWTSLPAYFNSNWKNLLATDVNGTSTGITAATIKTIEFTTAMPTDESYNANNYILVGAVGRGSAAADKVVNSSVIAYYYKDGNNLYHIAIVSPTGAEIFAPTNCGSLFSGCSAITTIEFNSFNTTGVTYMHFMFNNCSKLSAVININWDTSSVLSVGSMFYGCYTLTSLDLSDWNISSVIIMSSMFRECNKLTSIGDLRGWDVSSVTDMSSMFNSCYDLISLDLSNWDVSSVTDMSFMFATCSDLTSVGDISGWNVSSVKNMSYMFQHCSKLTSLDLSDWELSVVTNTTDVLIGCSKLVEIKAPKSIAAGKTLGLPSISGKSWYVTTDTSAAVTEIGNDTTPATLGKTLKVGVVVTFNANGGEVSPTRAVVLNGNNITLPTPTRVGYSFNGWYTAATGGTKVGNAGANYTPTGNITLYAQWEANTATITIKKDGANWSSSGMNVALYNGTTVAYAYSTATASGATVTFSVVVNGTYNVYATRATGDSTLVDTGVDITISSNKPTVEINYYSVTRSQGSKTTLTTKYDSSSGTAFTSTTYVLKGTKIYIEATASTGYTLSLTVNGSAFTSGNVYTVSSATTIAIASSATANKYTVKFNANKPTGASSSVSGSTADQSFTYDVPQYLRTNGFTLTGWTFQGWNTAANGSGTTYSNQQSVNNLTATNNGTVNLYAQWKANTYTVTFFADGETITASNGWTVSDDSRYAYKSVTYDSAIGAFPTVNGYVYNGAVLGSQKMFYHAVNGEELNGTTYRITFKDDLFMAGQTIYFKLVTLAEVFTGLSINGTAIPSSNYQTSVLLQESGYSYISITGSYTIPAGTNYLGSQSFMDFIFIDGTFSTFDGMPLYYDGEILGENCYMSLDYNPNGTSTVLTSSSIVNYNHDFMLSANELAGVIYYVQFDSNKPSNASQNVSGTMSNQTFTYGSRQNLTTNAYLLTGWTFQGWNTAANGSGTTYADKASVINLTATNGATVTLYAQWKANTYTVSFNANGGSGGQSASVTATYDSAMPSISTTAPTKTGYTFGGWYDTSAATGGTKYYNADGSSARTWNKTANATLYARWTVNKYTVSFDANGGTGGQSADVTATYGSAMPNISTTKPTKTGYIFNGWFDATTGGTKYYNADGSSARNWDKTSNTTLYARWTANEVRIFVYKDGAAWSSSGMNVALYSGTTVKYAHTNATASGSYISWSAVAAGTYNIYASKSSNAKSELVDTGIDITIDATTAIGTATINNYYTLTLSNGTGIASNSGDGVYLSGQIANISATPNAGYTFTKWTKNSGNSPASTTANPTTVTITAKTSITSSATANIVTITINLNDSAWSSSGMNVALYNGTTVAYAYSTGTASGATVKFSAVANGTYNVYAGKNDGAKTTLVDTGVDITVNSTGSATINYYSVTRSQGPGTILTTKYDNSSGAAVASEAIVLSGVKVYIAATLETGCTELVILVNGSSFTSGNTYTVSSSTTIQSSSTDTVNPIVSINRTNYNTFSWSVSDNHKIVMYAITDTSTQPTNWATDGKTSGSKEITSGEKTWYVWAKDAHGNVGFNSIAAYEVSLGNVTYFGAIDSFKLNSASGTELTQTGVYTMLAGTVIYIYATAGEGYNTPYIMANNSIIATGDASSVSALYTVSASGNVFAKATENTVTITLKKDGAAWNSSNMLVRLFQGSLVIYGGNISSGSTIEWRQVPNGTYHVHASRGNSGVTASSPATTTIDTGIDITVNNSTCTATIDYYTITTNKGTGIFSAYCSSGSVALANIVHNITATASTGYTFKDWTVNSGDTPASTTSSETTITLTQKTTLTANATVNTYAITFDQQGGSGGTASTTATYDSAMPAITKPTRTGYTFAGYYTETNGGGTIYYYANGTSATTWNIANNATLYAKWTANKYTISFDANGGSGGQSANVTATYDSAMPSISTTAPSRTGYTFTGWFDAASGGTQYYTKEGASARSWNKTANTKLYAQWEGNKYTVTLNNQSATTAGTESVTAIYGSAMPAITVPTKTGYEFGGYFTSTGGSGRQYYTAAGASVRNWDLTSNTTLYAKWTPKTYHVTYNPNGGNGSTYTHDIVFGSPFVLLDPTDSKLNYSRAGYWFDYWSPSQNGSDASWKDWIGREWAWGYDHDVTFYAQWQPNYHVVYNANGGSGTMSDTVVGWGDSITISACTYTKTGYKFSHWAELYPDGTYKNNGWTDWSGTWQYENGQYSISDYKLNLYAIWTPNKYTITFDKQGGSGGQSANVTATYDSAMPSISTTKPTRTGYTFGGWYDATSGGTQYYTAAGASARTWNKTANTTLYARWTANTYSIELDQDGGLISRADTGTYTGNNASIVFNGVYYVFTNTGTSDPYASIGATVYLTAGTTYYMYMRIYDENGEALTSGSVQIFYAIGGSYSEGNSRRISAPGGKTTFTVSTTGTYQIRLDNDCGKNIVIQNFYISNKDLTPTISVTYGSAVPAVALPTKTGYTFDGYQDFLITDGATSWYPTEYFDRNGNWVYDTLYTIDRNIWLVPSWTPNTYTVSFDANGGSGGQSASVTATYGSAMPSITTTKPTKAGYTFDGWYDAVSGGTKYYNADGSSARTWNKTANTTLYARWIEGVAVTFTINNSTNYSDVSIKINGVTTSLTEGQSYTFTLYVNDSITVRAKCKASSSSMVGAGGERVTLQFGFKIAGQTTTNFKTSAVTRSISWTYDGTSTSYTMEEHTVTVGGLKPPNPEQPLL